MKSQRRLDINLVCDPSVCSHKPQIAAVVGHIFGGGRGSESTNLFVIALQRDVTQKVSIKKLWFLHSACRLMLVNICMKFHENILNDFKVIKRT